MPIRFAYPRRGTRKSVAIRIDALETVQTRVNRPAEAARRLGIDVRRVRAAVERKEIPSVEIANRRLIPAAAIERLIENY